MDKTLKLKLKTFKKALSTLEKALKSEHSDLARDSSIQRFEYSYELCWKTSKIFLKEHFGVETFSPKPCFRELRKNQLLSAEETEILLEMVNDRNLATHTYNEKFAIDLFKKIKSKYYKTLVKIYETIEAKT